MKFDISKIIFFKILNKNKFNHTHNNKNSLFQLIHDYKAYFYKQKTGNYIFILDLHILEFSDYFIKCKYNYLDDERYFLDHIHYTDLINYYFNRANKYNAYTWLVNYNLPTEYQPKPILKQGVLF